MWHSKQVKHHKIKIKLNIECVSALRLTFCFEREVSGWERIRPEEAWNPIDQMLRALPWGLTTRIHDAEICDLKYFGVIALLVVNHIASLLGNLHILPVSFISSCLLFLGPLTFQSLHCPFNFIQKQEPHALLCQELINWLLFLLALWSSELWPASLISLYSQYPRLPFFVAPYLSNFLQQMSFIIFQVTWTDIIIAMTLFTRYQLYLSGSFPVVEISYTTLRVERKGSLSGSWFHQSVHDWLLQGKSIMG